MASIQEIKEYKNSDEFKQFLEKFHQNKEIAICLKNIKMSFKDDDDLQIYNILSDSLKKSSVSLDEIKENVKNHSELFFSYYKEFLLLYSDDDLANDIDEDDDYEPEDDEIIEKWITSHTLLHCLIDFHLLRTNQEKLLKFHKDERIPNAKKHSKNLIELFEKIKSSN